jgi:hypothetical protein
MTETQIAAKWAAGKSMSRFDILYNRLTDREKAAVTFCRANYRAWRKRLLRTREEHNAARPDSIDPRIWDDWFNRPYGDKVFNAHIRIARKVLAQGRI